MIQPALCATILLLGVLSFVNPSARGDSKPLVIINEVVYDPLGDEVMGEWIELYNAGELVNLEGWILSDLDGHEYTFPPIEAPSGTYVVIHVGDGNPDLDFDDGSAHLYMNLSSPILNNFGDELLLDSGGASFDFFSYGPGGSVDYPPRDVSFDGRNLSALEGLSLSLFPDGTAEDNPSDWHEAIPTMGKPNGIEQKDEGRIVISEVYYHSYTDDEYVCVMNPSGRKIDISGWILSDLEGALAFPIGTVIETGVSLCIAQNGTSFKAETGRKADFDYAGGNESEMISFGGNFVLNNNGDEVILETSCGKIIDVFLYGKSTYEGIGWEGKPAAKLGEGYIARRATKNGTPVDTNSSIDWDSLSEWKIRQSNFATKEVIFDGKMVAYSSPDTIRSVLIKQVSEANKSIFLTLYRFADKGMSQHLLEAVEKGVKLKLLLEGGPVGGVERSEMEIVREISEGGGEVRFMMNIPKDGVWERYRFLHSKYAVIDNRTTIIQSENWGLTGLPRSGEGGNRGWGIVLKSEKVSRFFSQVFFYDWNPLFKDLLTFEEAESFIQPVEEDPPILHPYAGGFQSITVEGRFRAIPIVGPDNTLSEDSVIGLIRSSRKSVDVEQFYMDILWTLNNKEVLNPYVEELIDAARRGCRVRILLDSSWYNHNADENGKNDIAQNYLTSLAESENLDLEVNLIDLPEHGLEKLHNKGVIVDGEKVLISSFNWNRNSIVRNREVGVVVLNKTIAQFFDRIFSYDWSEDVTKPIARIGRNRTVHVGEKLFFNALGSTDRKGVASYSWDFDGDGIVDSREPIAFHSFQHPGVYTARVNVSDHYGNWDEDFCMVTVIPRKNSTLTQIAIICVAAGGPFAMLSSFLAIRRIRNKK